MQNSPDLIYLDHSATTSVRGEVLEAMLPWFSEGYGNPSSMHRAGRRAAGALTLARRTVAALLGAQPGEIIFNSGGSDGANAALRGIALARRAQSGANQIVVSAIEHKAVLATAEQLRDHFGFTLAILPVDKAGTVQPHDLERALAVESAVVSIHYANNEIGVIEPIQELAAISRAHGVPIYTDAVQAAGRLSLDVNTLGVDALNIAAHKFYGPKGVGALWLRAGTPFLPQQTGGSHEAGRRAGTENVPLIVGLAKALELAEAERAAEMARLQLLRDRLITGVLHGVEGAYLTGSATARLAHHTSFVLRGVEAEGVLIALDMAGIAASSGSACTSAAQAPSHVLLALGVPPKEAVGGLRFSLGRSNTDAHIARVIEALPPIIARMRTD